MLQDPNVGRAIEKATRPLIKKIEKLEKELGFVKNHVKFLFREEGEDLENEFEKL